MFYLKIEVINLFKIGQNLFLTLAFNFLHPARRSGVCDGRGAKSVKLIRLLGNRARGLIDSSNDDTKTSGTRQSKASIYKIEEFFEEDDRPGLLYPTLAKWIVSLSALSFIAWSIFFALLPTQPSEGFTLFHMGYEMASKTTEFLLVVLTILISLLASVLAVYMINRWNLAKLKFIKDITHRDALKAVLLNLKGFDGRFSESKHVKLIFEGLKTTEANDFQAIKVTQTVHLRRRFVRGELILDFVELERDGGTGGDSITYDLQSDTVPDDSQMVDITDIRDNFADEFEMMFPGIVEVIIDNRSQPFEVEFVKGRENHRRWRINTARWVGEDLIDVYYRYSYYHELTGFAFQELTEPTHGFNYSLDYQAVASSVNVYQIGDLNARQTGMDVGKRHRTLENQIEVSTDEWVIPNSTVVFCWYKQPPNETAIQNAASDGSLGTSASAQPKPGARSRAAMEENLSVDGNCLGLALLDVFEAFNLTPPVAEYARLSSPADAIRVLQRSDGIRVELASRAAPWERWLLKLQAKRFGLVFSDNHDFGPGDIALCMRSMRQLYGLRRAEAHWVVVANEEPAKLLDRLAELVQVSFKGINRACADSVLDQKGVTFRICAT